MKFFAIIIIVLGMQLINAKEAGKNIIINSGFESVKDGFPIGWQNYNNGAKLTTDNLDEANGKQALVVFGTGKLCGFQQNVFKVKIEARYKLEVNALFDGFTAGEVTPIYVTVFRNQGKPLCKKLVNVKPEGVRNVDGWKAYFAILDMSKIVDAKGHVCVWSIVSKDFKGSVYFDNFTMKKIIE